MYYTPLSNIFLLKNRKRKGLDEKSKKNEKLPYYPKKRRAKRLPINKVKREAVYKKYDGHCAYCGREIEYKDMQVDHFKPLRAWSIDDAGTDDLSNLMPSCRMCNHYKRANSLETFRRYIEEIPRKLKENYIYKVGLIYGNVSDIEKPIKFYFEIIDSKNKEECKK